MNILEAAGCAVKANVSFLAIFCRIMRYFSGGGGGGIFKRL